MSNDLKKFPPDVRLLFHFLFFCIKSYTISVSNKEWGNYTWQLIYKVISAHVHFTWHHMWLSCDLCLCCIGQRVNHVCEACMLLLTIFTSVLLATQEIQGQNAVIHFNKT